MTTSVISCCRCGASGTCTLAKGRVVADPPGWEGITLTGTPLFHRRLCADCAAAVRDLLATSPAEVERRRDAEREAAFAKGFDAGLAEPRDTGGWFVQHETRQLLYGAGIGLADEPVTPLADWLVQHRTEAVS